MTKPPLTRQATHPSVQEASLDLFFSPQGVVVIGASQNPRKLGFAVARNLIQSGYQGAIHFVNPKGGMLLNRILYPNLDQVPDPIDLAILLIPAQYVPQSLKECGERGIRAAIIGSGGFRETGPQGAALEDQCLSVARDYGIRLIGPNCIGVLDTHIPLDTTFLPPPGPTPGDVAFISHSGAICAAVVDWARGQGFGLSRLVSLGNQLDVTEADVLAPVVADDHTKVITLYLEGISDGQRFVREARRLTTQKPIIALKVGRYESGRRAVASHTGAMAGQESAFQAAFRRAGVIRADTSEELFDWARVLAWCPPPKGRSVAILTNAGGPGATAADALEAHGLRLAKLREETCAVLRAFLPPAASVQNPVDMLATASPEQYVRCLNYLLADPGVHSVLVILPPLPIYTAGGVARSLIPTIYSAEKPVVIALMGERMIQEAVEYFRAARVPEYRFPERAAAALAILAKRAEFLQRTHETPQTFADVEPGRVTQLLARCRSEESSTLPQETASQILSAYGLPVPPVALAESEAEAVEHAHRVGFPVALKVASPDILHKTDVGGVQLNLITSQDVADAYRRVIENARSGRPDAQILGVHVQPMIRTGQEVILGAIQDPQFGPLVMFGSGGVEVEGIKDVDFSLAPMAPNEAEQLLENTWAGRRLHGFRNLPPADRDAVINALLRLAQLAADFPELAEIEINPLRVLEAGQGAWAVDVRLRRTPLAGP